MYIYNLTFILGFLPVTVLCYYLAGALFHRWGKSAAAENVVLCIASLYFFYLQENAYLPVLIGMIAADYVIGWLIYSLRSLRQLRRTVFGAAILLHVLVLILFGGSALADFLAKMIGGGLAIARTPGMLYTETSGIVFGGIFGVLFYTLHGISYLSDIYLKKADPEKNPVNVAVYLAMFPLMIVGPVRIYRKVREQLHSRNIRRSKFSHGVMRTGIGWLKITLLGLTFRELFRTILSEGLSNLTVIGAAFLWFVFFLAIYFLFTGCSDMARGMCLMLGFDLEPGYDAPCTSLSVTEYWKRWNISLSEWFREYVYIPLGGNHCDRNVQAWNLFLTWLCIGLWHGFSFNTILYGAFFGLLTVAEFLLSTRKKRIRRIAAWRRENKASAPQPARRNTEVGQFTFQPENFRNAPGRTSASREKEEHTENLPKTPRRIYVIFCVLVAWLLLMFETPEELLSFLRALFGLNGAGLGDRATLYYMYSNLLLILAALICMTHVPEHILEYLFGERNVRFLAGAACVCVLVLCAAGLFVSPEILEEDNTANRFYCKITTYVSRLTNQQESKGIYFGDDGYLLRSYKSWLVDENVQEENLNRIAEQIEAIRQISVSADETDGADAAADTDTTGDMEEAADTDTTGDTEAAADTDTTGGAEEAEDTGAAREISVTCVLVPSAGYIRSDVLPAYAPEWDEGETESAAKQILGSAYISSVAALKSKSDEEIYYHSETGVTSLGAYYVYANWADSIGLTPGFHTQRTIESAYDSFYGSLARELRIYPKADRILRYRSFQYITVEVTYSDGTVTDSIYEEKYLGTKQELNYFLNGTQDIVRVTTSRNKGEKLLVITDDSGRRYMQYFILHYGEITMVNINEYEGDVMELLEETGAGEVLYLFDMTSVYADTAIAEKLKN